jgi:hypothetical protein
MILVDAGMSSVMVQLRTAGHDAVHVREVLRLNARMRQSSSTLPGSNGCRGSGHGLRGPAGLTAGGETLGGAVPPADRSAASAAARAAVGRPRLGRVGPAGRRHRGRGRAAGSGPAVTDQRARKRSGHLIAVSSGLQKLVVRISFPIRWVAASRPTPGDRRVERLRCQGGRCIPSPRARG